MAGSERVTLDGKLLSPGKEYEIDHREGSIQLPDESALLPESSLEVYYVALPSADAGPDFRLKPGRGDPELRWLSIHIGVRERRSIMTSPASPAVEFSYHKTGTIRASEAGTARPWEKKNSPEEESLNRAVRFMVANQGEKAIEEFQSFIRQFPRSPEVPRTQYCIALCRYNLRQFARAAELFESCTRSYPDSGFAADALFYLADSHYNLGNFEKSVKGFDTLIGRYPKGGKVEEALFTKAWALLDLREKEKAAEAFQRLIREYPDGRFAPGARAALEDLRSPKSDSPEVRREYYDARKSFEEALERRQASVPKTIVPAEGVIARKDFEKASAVRDKAKREKDRKLYRAAAERFVNLIERYPGSVFTLEAYIQASACYEAAGEPEQADVLYEKIINASRRGGIVLPPELEPTWPVWPGKKKK
jgi:TolA-binding protein